MGYLGASKRFLGPRARAWGVGVLLMLGVPACDEMANLTSVKTKPQEASAGDEGGRSGDTHGADATGTRRRAP